MKLIPVLALGVVSALLAGCAGGAYQAKNAEKYNQETNATFVLMDSGAQRSVTSSGLQTRTLPDGRLEVGALLRNREERRIQVQVQCVFKDSAGFSTGDETPWENVILTENGQETVRFTSMNNLASKFTVRVRQAR
jgi:uncharacterized protein YcfL